MKNVLTYIVARIKEPSTWAGIGVAILPLAAYAPAIAYASAVCGGMAAFMSSGVVK
jgi:hypothetical protein